jgi:hypothetical protein
MRRHLTRDHFYRTVAGAITLLVVFSIAIFAASRHFAI